MTDQDYISQGYIQVRDSKRIDCKETIVVVTDPVTQISRHLVFLKQDKDWVFDDFSRKM